MSSAPEDARNEIATVARAFSRLNYVHAFGHVSQRLERSILITSTRPLADQLPSDVIEVDFQGRVVSGDANIRPIEVFLHIGIYEARVDVAAICRAHPPFASTWPTDGEAPPIQHGFGGIARSVAAYEDCDLIHSLDLGKAAARRLGASDALILRGNGVVTVGKSLREAAARMWSLEERFAQAWRQGIHLAPFSEADIEARERWYKAEIERVWNWLRYVGRSESGDRRPGS